MDSVDPSSGGELGGSSWVKFVKKIASAPDVYPDIAGSISGYSWTKESG